MENPPSSEANASTTPEPEVLKPRTENAGLSGETPAAPDKNIKPKSKEEIAKLLKRRTYRPSHKATFIGLAVVSAILLVNAGVIFFVLKGKSSNDKKSTQGQVTISAADLSKIGVNSTSIGNSGIELVVEPNAKFNGKLNVAGDVNISGKLQLNSSFSSSEANITKLGAGSASFTQLDVNGNATITNLNLRNGLIVSGPTQLQGTVTISQLLTVNNNVNIIGNLAVGGSLSTNSFVARNLTATSDLIVGGHIVTAGLAPAVSAGGGALGSNGTVAISGNDAAGTVNINIGVGASNGTLASVTFRTQYVNAPRIVISAINIPASITCAFYVANRTLAGFTIVDSCSLPPGGYAVDYIVQQ